MENKNGLLLKRKVGESIIVGDAIIKILEIGKSSVRIAIQAPKTTRILREELKDIKWTHQNITI